MDGGEQLLSAVFSCANNLSRLKPAICLTAINKLYEFTKI
jgi:hypothetical protein